MKTLLSLVVLTALICCIESQVESPQRDAKDFDAMKDQANKRMYIRNQLIEDYIDGRISVEDASNEYYALCNAPPRILPQLCDFYKTQDGLEACKSAFLDGVDHVKSKRLKPSGREPHR